MQVNSLQRPVNAADIAPEKLAANGTVSERAKIAEASRQFESLLLRQVLSAAQKPVVASPLIKDSASSSIYRDMATTQLADSISRSGGFGLARMLEPQMQKQLVGKQTTTVETASARTAGLQSSAVPNARTTSNVQRSPASHLYATNNRAITSPLRSPMAGHTPPTPATNKSEATPAHASLLMLKFSSPMRRLTSHE